MTINLQVLGSKLRKYREQLGETTGEVSKSTGIVESRLADIESGNIEPSGDDILILADHFRCDFNFFISNDPVAPFEQTETLYRAHGNEFTKGDRRAIQDFLYLCDTEEMMIRDLGRQVLPFSFSPTGSYFKAHAEAAATELRSFLGYSDIEVPRDIYADFRSIGVHLFRRKLGNSRISGLFVLHPTAGRCALVNYSEDIYRQRFSAAHEMAHVIFDASKGPSVSFERPLRDNMLEIRANHFASCFLMPPSFLKKIRVAWTDDEALHWANALRVSCHALAIALKEAGLIDGAAFNRICRLRVGREAKVDPELPESLHGLQRDRKEALMKVGLSDYYVNLCFDAFDADLVSIGRLSEALLCSQNELRDTGLLFGRSCPPAWCRF